MREFNFGNAAQGNIITQKIPFLFLSGKLMTPTDSTNNQNICVDLFKATITH